MSRITSTEANRRFSELLAQVRKGQTTEITVRGEVVAKIVPVVKASPAKIRAKQKAFSAFMKRLREQPVLNAPRVNRIELYD